IRIASFAAQRRMTGSPIPPVICLLGRVVPIKDIKTLIRSMLRVVHQCPQAQAWIVGPTDEDEEYAQECRNLVASLGLQSQIKFLGFQRTADILPQVGLMVLSSISEALPLAVLNVFFYLDQRRIVLWLCLQLVVLNVLLTGVSLYLGAAFYGYGFALAMLLTMCTGLHLLNRELARLEYRTFMLQ
ncbi:MAG: GT4 family glycosyltransferase PelF, partial [Comamonadaceae bacterium]|nr:GT4 family glycosyltransferase PelF [Comamonadaceae bacterium]